MAKITPSAVSVFLNIPASQNRNFIPFLDMLAWSEGTDPSPNTHDCGYDILVGGTRFLSYGRHPNITVDLPKFGISSTAAGRYQILSRYWDHYAPILKLQDFGPVSQDIYALNMLREVHAVDSLVKNDIQSAIYSCSSRWASLPGNNYGQHQHKIDDLIAHFVAAGGRIST